MRDTKQEILNFWFVESSAQQWFTQDRAFDRDIIDRFLLAYDMSGEGLSDAWSQSAEGALALCLLWSEFPRHMFRDTPRMFLTDPDALAVANHAVKQGFDQRLPHEQRVFLYLPFGRSEKIADQKRNLDLCEGIAHENPMAYRAAQERYKAIEQFGRFPQRNAILGRESSKEEVLYLKQHGSNFNIV